MAFSAHMSSAVTARERDEYSLLKRGRRVVKTIKRPFGAGADSLRLPALKPAGYTVSIAARDASGNTGRASLSFRVKKK